MKPSAGVVTLVRSLTTKKGRAKHGMYLISGIRVIGEAISAGHPIEYLLVSTSDMTSTGKQLLQRAGGLTVYEMPSRDFRRIDQTSTTQGVLAVMMQREARSGSSAALGSCVLALDSINDPSNLGAMLRSALAFGFESVVLSKGCVELFSPKVISTSAGSLFHLRIQEGSDLSVELANMRALGYRVVGSSADGDTLTPTDLGVQKLCLVIGNEARGLSMDVSAKCDVVARIPMAATCESLSAPVAAAILMYEVSKSRVST